MTRAFFISLAFHAIIVALLIVGLPSLRRDPEVIEAVQIVELVEVSDETTSLAETPAAETKPVEAPPAPKPPEPKPEPKPEPAPPPPAPEPEPEPEPEPVPEPPEPQPIPVPEPEPEPVPEPEPEPEPEPAPEPEPEPEPEPQPEPQKEVSKPPPPPPKPKVPEAVLKAEREQPKPKTKDAFDSLLDAVNQLDKQPSPSTPQTATAKPTNTGGRISQKLTMSETDAISHHVSRSWNYNQGGRGIEHLQVMVSVTVNPDGSVSAARAQRDSRFAGDPLYAALASSAERAVLRASPLPIPRDKFDVFADGFSLRFTPQGIDFN
jgi:outer membrane biosynthesis protein TonB